MAPTPFDLIVVGGGIVGTATALALTRTYPGLKLAILEKEDHLAAHQTGHNSGVIHSGLYYRPGSLKAQNCAAGREALYTFCAERKIAVERCGKIVVATRESELPALDELERRGIANGLAGLERLDAAGVKEHEPHVAGIAGLYVPQTGIVDYVEVTNAYAQVVRESGGVVRTGCRVNKVERQGQDFRLTTNQGDFACHTLINCAGLQSDRFARACGIDPGVQIIPFRGEYYLVTPQRQDLVRNLIYPVPDPAFPFLGVHFTRMIHGGVEAGPNAVLALRREGYGRFSFSLPDLFETLTYRGFYHLARRFWQVGAMEYHRSYSKSRFVRDLQKLLPELQKGDVARGGSGVRAQAVDAQGKLLDDFHIINSEGMVHVLNAPSPAATASLSIGSTIAQHAGKAVQR
ncbi:MAG: L-2-hydroxyglutarate oxidase [Deltaproteobacteria bacterium HGW-Deltaproteobacteria-4]|nr:MAG: L-2-hydroxyglutarate oxidase [Deltaproteobacteria bacterium HGW-Deltaproteobacteria-4]